MLKRYHRIQIWYPFPHQGLRWWYYNRFVPSTIKLWNDLPGEYKNSITVSAFKKCFKNSTHEQLKKHKLYNHGNRLENVLQLQNIVATWMLIFFHTICKSFRIAYTVFLNGKIPNTFSCILLNTKAKGKSYFIIWTSMVFQ